MTFEEQTLIVGIGAPRCGTTWLHDYLRRRADVYMSPIKELHYWDARFRPDRCAEWNRRFEDLAHDRNARRATGRAVALDRVRMTHDEAAYIHFFRTRTKPWQRAFGEITPAYCLLPHAGFACLKAQHPNVKIVYLLRDPIERFYSGRRMDERDGQGGPALDGFLRALDDNDGALERSRFDLTLERLDDAFDSSHVLIEFYERLFTEPTVRRICEFLAIPYEPALASRRSNAAPGPPPLPLTLRRAARERFAPVYAYCRRRFGSEIPNAWSQ